MPGPSPRTTLFTCKRTSALPVPVILRHSMAETGAIRSIVSALVVVPCSMQARLELFVVRLGCMPALGSQNDVQPVIMHPCLTAQGKQAGLLASVAVYPAIPRLQGGACASGSGHACADARPHACESAIYQRSLHSSSAFRPISTLSVNVGASSSCRYKVCGGQSKPYLYAYTKD